MPVSIHSYVNNAELVFFTFLAEKCHGYTIHTGSDFVDTLTYSINEDNL